MSGPVTDILGRLNAEYEARLLRSERARQNGAPVVGNAVARDAHGIKIAIDIVKEYVDE